MVDSDADPEFPDSEFGPYPSPLGDATEFPFLLARARGPLPEDLELRGARVFEAVREKAEHLYAVAFTAGIKDPVLTAIILEEGVHSPGWDEDEAADHDELCREAEADGCVPVYLMAAERQFLAGVAADLELPFADRLATPRPGRPLQVVISTHGDAGFALFDVPA